MSLSVNFPEQRPTLNLNFARARQLDPRITFTRASTATYFDSSGVLQTAIAGQPRFDFSPTTGESLGLLIEEQRTNSIRNNTMQGAVAGTPGTLPTNWSQQAVGGVALTEVVGTGVEDGIAYVDVRYTGTTSSGSAGGIYTEGFSVVSATTGQTWAASAFVRLIAGSTSGINSININLMERNASSTFLAQTVTAINPTSGPLSSQRGLCVRTTNQATVAFVHQLISLVPQSGVPIDITLRIGLPQLEQGAFATSVIPTTTAAATRNADVASMTGTNFSSWYNQNNSTMYVQFSPVGATATSDFGAFTVDNGTFGRGYTVLSRTGIVRFSRRDATGQVASNINYSGTSPKAITTLSVDSANRNVNGGAINTDSTVLSLTDMTTLRIGFNNITGAPAVNYLNGHIQRLSCYPVLLSNDQLQALTR